jgi:hypothetical protein
VSVVYSAKLLVVPAYIGPALIVYTVPAGIRTVVRSVSLSVGVNLGPGSLILRHEPTGAVMESIAALSVGFLTTHTVDAHWVLNAGESLAIETTGGYVGDFYVSGYELTLP